MIVVYNYYMIINENGDYETISEDFDIIFAMIWYGITRFDLTDPKLRAIIRAYHLYSGDIELVVMNQRGIKEYEGVLAIIRQPGRENFDFGSVFEKIIEKNLMDFRLFTRCFKHLEQKTIQTLLSYTSRDITGELNDIESNERMMFELGRIEAKLRRSRDAII